MNPAAFFSVIFVQTKSYQPEEPITLEYSWYGNFGYKITGEWVDLYVNFTMTNNDDVSKDFSVPIKAFVSYQATPAQGLDGFLSISYSKYNHDANFLAQLNALETDIPILNC